MKSVTRQSIMLSYTQFTEAAEVCKTMAYENIRASIPLNDVPLVWITNEEENEFVKKSKRE